MEDDKTPEQVAAEAKAAEEAAKAAAAKKEPALDAAKLAKDMADQVVGGIKKMAEDAAQAQARQPQPNAQRDPLVDAIAPIVSPAIQQVGVRAEAASDAAMFYSDPDPDMAHFKATHKKEVEDLFKAELAAGRFTPREDILSYLRGGKLFNEVVDFEVGKRKKAEEAARAAETAGPGGTILRSHAPARDPYTMTPEELDKALDNVAF